ncbi:hypothetical protein Q8A64_13685 [Oxalobacteraceae bacterium R-40]|uniref:DUF883 domain-containing protein n=1 Tax=Keguizhuia sedimenti TaxID=3064264 RepID=A0ABU1BR34_9BURK|nr:hypothetical protein [Oxalobacteraceae bacterium R-40]
MNLLRLNKKQVLSAYKFAPVAEIAVYISIAGSVSACQIANRQETCFTNTESSFPLAVFTYIQLLQEGASMETPKTVPIGSDAPNGSNSASWDRTVEQAKSGAHTTIDRLSESARPAVDKFSATAHQTVDKLSDVASQASATFSEKFSQAKGSQQQLLDDTRAYVREKPGTAIAIAVAAGFILRSIFRSR